MNKHKKKKLLIYAHYYIPDSASTGQILSELAQGLRNTFDITVICVVPSYLGVIEEEYKRKKMFKENINGVCVFRIRVPEFNKHSRKSRIKNILSYFFGALLTTFKVGKQDFILSISQPPILGGLLGVIGKWFKKAKFIYNIQDYNPEQIIAVGYNKSSLLLNFMMMLDKFTCRKSDLVITVGRDLQKTLENRFKKKNVPKSVVINNWIDEKEIYPLNPEHDRVMEFKKKFGLCDKFIIMYSGNIGLYYDLENIIKIIKRVKPHTKASNGKEVEFVFVGDGSILNDLKGFVERNQMSNVSFIPYQDKVNLMYSLNAADVHWCVNAKGIKGVSCPSKYYGIAATGKCALAVLEAGTEIRNIIENTKSGLCCSPGEYEQIEKNIYWFINNAESEEMLGMGARGRDNLVTNLSKEASIKRYGEEILRL